MTCKNERINQQSNSEGSEDQERPKRKKPPHAAMEGWGEGQKFKKIPKRTKEQAKRLLTMNVTGKGSCREWNGHRTRAGYAVVSFDGKQHYCHRLAYEVTNGKIPKGMEVCHHCDNPPCINPDHLFLGTHKENMQDAAQKGRLPKPEAKHGSEVSNSVLTESEVLNMRRLRASGMPYRTIGAKLRVSTSTVFYALSIGWKHI